MHVIFDRVRCQGHGLCVIHAPDAFELAADGYCLPGERPVPPAFEAQARRAVAGCPERAITLKGEQQ